MKSDAKIAELRATLERDLAPLIDCDYRLLEMPDYANIGDVLIFQGEQAFLDKLPFRCREMATMFSFGRRLPEIPESDLLIFSGGGYFGDLWPVGPAFQAKVLERYPRNPMLILPQSVCFRSQEALDSAVKRYGAHSNLTICLRDRPSYEFVRRHFRNEARLLPDMAFYADVGAWRSQKGPGAGTLLIRRGDLELKPSARLETLAAQPDVDVRDWPTIAANDRIEHWMQAMRRHPRRSNLVYDLFVRTIYRRHQLRLGVRFLEPYAHVCSTRLHGGVMALLMGKKVTFFDNSYGKIRGLAETWLGDCDDVEMAEA